MKNVWCEGARVAPGRPLQEKSYGSKMVLQEPVVVQSLMQSHEQLICSNIGRGQNCGWCRATNAKVAALSFLAPYIAIVIKASI